MIDITFKCMGNDYEFQVDKYNQMIVSSGMNLYLSLLERFNDLNAIKYDDYIGNLFESSVIVNGKKISKKNVLFIDFSNPDAILKNLSFDKTSIIRKNYVNKLANSINEDDYENLVEQIRKIVDSSNVELTSKEPVVEKIFDLFYDATNSSIEDLLLNYNSFNEHIEMFREENESIYIFVLIDSGHKHMDIDELKQISNLFILDRCIDINKYSNNFIHFSKEITTIEKSNLIESVINHWPTEIESSKVILLLQEYFSSCLSYKVGNLIKIRAEVIVLYNILCNLLYLEPDIIFEKNNILMPEL